MLPIGAVLIFSRHPVQYELEFSTFEWKIEYKP